MTAFHIIPYMYICLPPILLCSSWYIAYCYI